MERKHALELHAECYLHLVVNHGSGDNLIKGGKGDEEAQKNQEDSFNGKIIVVRKPREDRTRCLPVIPVLLNSKGSEEAQAKSRRFLRQ